MVLLTRNHEQQLQKQDGVASVGQLLEWGFDHATLSRRARSGDWQRLHRGVYALHSGPLTWRARARAALLLAGPDAALSHLSAGYAQQIVRTPPQRIEVSVPSTLSPAAAPGVRFYRRQPMPFVLRSGLARTHPAEMALDLLGLARDTDNAVSWLTEAVRSGATPHEIFEAAKGRPRLRHRGLLEEIFGATDGAAESALEHRYRRDVERKHGLPRAQFQVRQVLDGKLIRADGIYVGFATRVELDGQLAHPGGRTDQDTWRDNAVLLAFDERTLRYRWVHVTVTPCDTAAQVLRALRKGGYRGPAHPCGPDCAITLVDD